MSSEVTPDPVIDKLQGYKVRRPLPHFPALHPTIRLTLRQVRYLRRSPETQTPSWRIF